MARNIFDTIEMCDKHFNEKTFGNVSSETTPNNKDNESVVDVNVDGNEDGNEDDNADIIDKNNNETLGGNENES